MKNLTQAMAIAGFAALALAPQAHAFGTPSAQEFVNKASIGGNFEVQSSQLALQKSNNADVKAFAQKMIADHTAANNTLKATADQAGFGSAVATGLDKKHQKMIDKLAKKDTNDDDFDKAYYRAQEKAHKETVSLFKDYSKDGDNTALKTFASNTLPTLESHEQAADALEEKVEKAE